MEGMRSRIGLVVVALAIVYVVWGSTYLAIRVAVEQLPPLLGMGSRFLTAGALLAVVLRLRGVDVRVTRSELVGCALLGLMLPFLGNGLVAVGEDHGAPSGVAALLVAAVPIWVTLYRFLSGDRPRMWSVVGVLLGFAGLAWLVLGGRHQGDVPLLGAALVLVASSFWAFGSWVQPRLTLPRNPFVITVHEMWTGGAMMVAAGLLRGESLHPARYDAHTWLAWATWSSSVRWSPSVPTSGCSPTPPSAWSRPTPTSTRSSRSCSAHSSSPSRSPARSSSAGWSSSPVSPS
jgi:drug/metabolite transporter (DMT)-like permease